MGTRLAFMRGRAARFGWVVLIVLAVFTVATSSMHAAVLIASGVETGARQSDGYRLAKAEAEAAQARASAASGLVAPAQERVAAAEASYERWKEAVEAQFGRGSAPFNLRMKADHPEHAAHLEAIARARGDYEGALSASSSAASAAPAALGALRAAEEQGGGAAQAVIGTMAGWLGVSQDAFGVLFSIGVHVLLELVCVFLAVLTGLAVRANLQAASGLEAEESRGGASGQGEGASSGPSFPDPSAGRPAARRGYRPHFRPSVRPAAAMAALAASAEDVVEEGSERSQRMRRPARFEAALERVRAAALSGRLTRCGQDAIRDLTGVSTGTASQIQARLEEEGVLVREGSRLRVRSSPQPLS